MPACHDPSKEPSVTTPIGHIQQQGDGGGAANRPQYSPPARPLVEVAANRKEGIEGKRVRRYEET
jgi:hypothetical protein